NRKAVAERIERVRVAIAEEKRTPFEIVPSLLDTDAELTPMMVNWGLSETLCYLRHLEKLGEVRKVDDEPERWLAA
ncbi:MAG TPA: hypothetical protein VGF74_20425, partial [Thermoleophilaceae bacterium]